jgi:integrase
VSLGTGAHVRCEGKGRKERCTPLTKSTVAVLQAGIREQGADGTRVLFPSARGGRLAATENVMKMLADLKVGKPDGAFIFPGDCNGFIDPDQFDAEVWKPIAEKAGMAGTRFHDLRHFFASQLIAQGETAASSIKITFDTYGHLFPGRGKQASARYEKSMAEARVRHKAEASVSNPLAIDGEEGPEGTVTN